ncbi:MAG: hypothetical protein QOE90_2315 [Thermoplasmata archaeon]|nr:hypothetical protein [Thermoplasmata archaeon]
MRLARGVAVLLAVLLLAGCTRHEDPLAPASSGGGAVLDVPAYFSALASDATQVDDGGAAQVVLSGTIQDNNSETDVAWIGASLLGSAAASVNHTVTAAERAASAEPASFGADGVKVWTGASAIDGALLFKWRVGVTSAFPPGLYVLNASEGNPGARVYGPQLPLTVTKPTNVAVAAWPVDASGAAQTGVSWGAWNASPGATSVTSGNYLKLVNQGGLSRPVVVVDFNDLAFSGASDPAYTIPINGNVAFAWWDDATPNLTAPSEGAYNFVTSADGSLTVQFGNASDIIYVAYRVLSLPSVLPTQTYAASFTATDTGGDDGANALPDLVMTSLTPSNLAPHHPAAVTFNATLVNIGLGGVGASGANVTFLASGSTFATVHVAGPIASGANVTLTTPSFTTSKGTFTIVARADAEGAVVETVDANNDVTYASYVVS